MKLSDFTWMTKPQHKHIRTEDAGRQIVLYFSKYHLSIIDDGYGREKGLFEIGVFKASDGVASEMMYVPGITDDGDTVKGHLTEDEVNVIIRKMTSITRTNPKQV